LAQTHLMFGEWIKGDYGRAWGPEPHPHCVVGAICCIARNNTATREAYEELSKDAIALVRAEVGQESVTEWNDAAESKIEIVATLERVLVRGP